MAKPKLAWWIVPSIVTGSLAAMGAVGTLIVQSAKWITLPEKVEAGEQKNVQQDAQLQELKAINETWQKIYQQQQTQPPASVPVPEVRLPEPDLYWWQDNDGTWWWCNPRTDCDLVENWRREAE